MAESVINLPKTPTITYSVQWNTICATALSLLGREATTDYSTDETSDAGLCRTFLPIAIAAASGYFNWTFLRKEESLSIDSTVSNVNYSYAYSLPVDIARLSGVSTYNDEPFSIQSGTIWTNSETLSITYQALPSSPERLPQAFTMAIIHYLAYLLSMPLTGNKNMQQNQFSLYQYWIDKAATDDRAYLNDNGKTWWTETIDG